MNYQPSYPLNNVGESLGIAAGRTVAKSHELAARVRELAERVGAERPIQLLAVLAGIAAAAGFATRIWRSSVNA